MNQADPIHSCCFTGYRPEKFRFAFSKDCPAYIDFENKLTEAVFSAADNGCQRFYSGAARGFDLAAAETVLLLRRAGYAVNLTCVLPYRGQADGWDIAWRRRYLEVLKAADDIVMLSEGYNQGCFARRNRYMVEHSDMVITYFDGVPGGTASTVRLAYQKGMTVVNIAEEYDQLVMPGMDP